MPRKADLVVLGRALRELRTAHQMDSAQLASRAGLERSLIEDVERGESDLSFIDLLRIAAALGEPAYELVFLFEERKRR